MYILIYLHIMNLSTIVPTHFDGTVEMFYLLFYVFIKTASIHFSGTRTNEARNSPFNVKD